MFTMFIDVPNTVNSSHSLKIAANESHRCQLHIWPYHPGASLSGLNTPQNGLIFKHRPLFSHTYWESLNAWLWCPENPLAKLWVILPNLWNSLPHELGVLYSFYYFLFVHNWLPTWLNNITWAHCCLHQV